MRKTTHIIAWFAGYVTCASIFVVAFILFTPARMYPHLFKDGNRALEGYMADFSKRSFKYQVSSHDNSIVIVGPSYAAAVGEADGIYNLGLAMADIPQIMSQVAKVKSADTPVFFLSIQDFIRQPMDENHPFKKKATWFPYIVKGIDLSLSGIRQTPVWSTREFQKIVENDRMSLYRNLSEHPETIDLGPLYEMREINGNIIFALTPIRLDDDCIADTHRALEVALSQSDLRCINLSRLLDDNVFYDRYHSNHESQKIVVAALRRQISL